MTSFYQNASVYPEYLAYPVNNEHQVFVPKKSVPLKRHEYYIGYLRYCQILRMHYLMIH